MTTGADPIARTEAEPLRSRPRRLGGALVISLDFELHWGVRDHLAPDGPYRPNLLGARTVVPRLLELFAEFDIAATWATVGLLFARTREEQQFYWPAVKPAYTDPRLSPYNEPVGIDEAADPIHFAATLIDQIRATPRQEIGTHTFSHYFCLEPGQTAEAFEADLAAAKAIAERTGGGPTSIVFPRNQHQPAYDPILRRQGITCYRGRQRGWMHQGVDARGNTLLHRMARFADLHVDFGGGQVIPWATVRQPTGLYDIPASAFLRPVGAREGWLDRRRRARLLAGLDAAARQRGLLHLWWHPHNFGRHPDQNLAFLRTLLQRFALLRQREEMQSLSMREVVQAAEDLGQ